MDAGPYRDGVLRVVSFRGREALSQPYRWDVALELEGVDFETLETDLLAQPASLEYTQTLEVPRVVHGVVSALRRDDASRDGLTRRVRARLVPRLALLSRSRMSRVFQDMSVPEIVREVLGEAEIPVALRLQQRYQPRVYCVQYQESDLAFVSRILAEEGIFYFFLQPPMMPSHERVAEALGDFLTAAGAAGAELAEVVVLGDHAGAYPPIAPRGELTETGAVRRAPTLVCHFDEGDIPDEHHVSRFTRERSVRPQATLLRDYTFRQPRLDLSAARSARAVPPGRPDRGVDRDFQDVLGDRLQRTVVRQGEAPAVSLDPRRATVYEHHGEDEDPEVTRTAAQVRFEQVRRRAIVASGASWCRRVGAGQRFVLDGHDDASLNGEYALTEVRHVGRTGSRVRGDRAEAAYQNAFSCVPVGVVFRPPPVPRVHRQVLETATVVGPPGEEIYTDHHGRVKVQFHWDLAGRGDERSSCWVRVNQTWGGASWGTQFIPRVGMEVIVSFLGGDQDRPVVLGCLYNGENTAPFVLPGDRTRSGIKTQSSPGGGGHNELSFEDAKGAEQVYLHAERNLDEVVERDRSVRVLHNERIHVTNDQSTSIGHDRSEAIGGSHEESLGGDRRLTVHGTQSHVTGKTDERWVRGDLQWRVDGRTRHTHAANAMEVYNDDHTVRIKGSQTTLVGDAEAPRHCGVHVEGTAEHYSSSGYEIRSDKEILLRCGKSSILLTPDCVEISAPNVMLHSDFTHLAMDAEHIDVRAKKDLVMRGDATATLLGPKVSLTTPADLNDQAAVAKITRISLKDEAGVGLPHQRYRLTRSDGAVRTGFLDKDGRAELPGDASGELEFPDVAEIS